MIRNYIIIAVRRLVKQFSYTAINVIGLSVGIAAFILIMLYIQYHLGFDQQIPDRDRLYRVVQIQQAEGVGEQHVAVNMGPLSETMVQELPEIIDAVRIMTWGKQPVRVNEAYYSQENCVWTDTEVFRLFGIKLLIGDTASALKEPNSIVLSETVAKKYFGDSSKAIGQLIEFNNENGYVVTGIMEDQPRNTHLWMDVLVSYESAVLSYPWLKSWDSNSMPVYVKLSHDADIDVVTEKINLQILKMRDPSKYTQPLKMYLQPVSEIHLKSGHIKFQINYMQGDSSVVLSFIVVAILIIVIACINFINLAIARSIKRAKEVGVRKVLGANRLNLMYQFLGESAIITFLAIIFALIIIELSLPQFNQLLGIELSMNLLTQASTSLQLIILWIAISLFSGMYPAFFMSRYQAIEVLRGNSSQGSRAGSGWLSKSLVIFQFVVAIALVIIVNVSNRQINYMLHKDLGYNYQNVIGISLPGTKFPQKAELLKNKLQQITSIKAIAAASFINGVAGNQSTITVADSAETRIMVRHGYVDEAFFPLMEIDIVEGRNFSPDFPNDKSESVILNQAAVNYLKWENPVGQRFKPFGDDTLTKRTVIGVINDYHYYSVHSKIEPAAYVIEPDGFEVLCVKYDAENSTEVVAQIEAVYNDLFPGSPFNWVSAAERLEKQYKNAQDSMKLLTLFSLLALLISAMGLYGLTALRVEQRTKEIGIRKVLGGSITQMMRLILKEFVVLVFVAGIIAIPVGYYFTIQILEQFAYSIKMEWYDAAIAWISALMIAALTIIYHARKAAKANPVEALKYE